jgi:glycosyltransferase involved in cell wall biosynthesis
MQVVGISNWLSSCAGDSHLFHGFQIETIANNIDTDRFFPVGTKSARRILGLPEGKRVILTGAQHVGVPYKGFDLFVEATRGLSREDVHLLLVGKLSVDDLSLLRQSHTSLGFLSDDVSLRLAYSAADVFVAPSRMEAFGKTLVEAMACGTPVVCFDATGPGDIVKHEVTGYKARPFAAEDLRCGIQWVLEQDFAAHERLRKDARERALALFDSQIIAQQYAELYRRLCH